MKNSASAADAQPDTRFINSEATKYNRFNSYHNEWIRLGIVATSNHAPLSGEYEAAKSETRKTDYRNELNKLERGTIVLLWVNKTGVKEGTPTGVVAAGVIIDEKDSCVTVRTQEEGKVSPHALEEFHRKVNWKYNLTTHPISCEEIKRVYGSNPSATIQALVNRKDKNVRDEILDLVAQRGIKLSGALQAEEVMRDLEEIDKNPSLSRTEKETRRLARVGQGKYRNELLDLWGGQCAVTGCELGAVLRASHIKPWKASDDHERLDPNNGLPLLATLDALFDKGLISFDDDGTMLLSATLSKNDLDLFGLPRSLRVPPNTSQRQYLGYHRNLLGL